MEKRKIPAVAILLATCNGEKYIGEQLDSLLRQTCQDFVCYIHDDASADGTADIIRSYAEMAPHRFIILEGPGTGSAKDNFFYLMQAVTGRHRFYLFCDQDDVWMPEKVQRLLDAMTALEGGEPSKPCLVFSDMKVAGEDLSIIHDSFAEYNHLWTDSITLDRAIMKDCAAGCTMMANQALLGLAVVQHTENIIMHDAWLVILAAALGRIEYLNIPLALYRQHGKNVLGAKRITKVSKALLRLKRLVSFTQYRVTRKGLYERIAQVSCGREVQEFAARYPELIEGAGGFPEMNKVKRCRFVIKHRLYQNSWSRLWTCICA